jgi:hypothetical protein
MVLTPLYHSRVSPLALRNHGDAFGAMAKSPQAQAVC